LHLWPSFPLGTVAANAGPIMAASDHFGLKITGSGSHAAMPHLAVDAVVIAAQVVTALQTLVAREVNPVELSVVTIGRIDAGTAFNAIPERRRLPEPSAL
jgi:metal-dependent amidase/aminoacylase/carboxypeptidase family protein